MQKESLQNQEVMMSKMSRIEEDISTIMFQRIEQSSLSQSDIKQRLKSLPDYHEWLSVKRKLRNLDVENNQYILIVDRFEEIYTENVKILADVPWKLVIDLDPDSDVDGFLATVRQGECRGGSIETFFPSRIKEDTNFDSQIDPRRILWLFANGRNRVSQQESANQEDNEDRPKNNVLDWKMSFKGLVQEFIRACCQKLNRMKPLMCIFLCKGSGVGIQIAQELLEEIHCKFVPKNFSTSYLSFSSELDSKGAFHVTFTALPEKLFFAGLTSLFGFPDKKYKLPSSQKELQVYLSQMKYNFLSEYLKLLYIGCEEIPEELPDDRKKAFINEHLKRFLCGKAISFPSLHYRHDALRCIAKDVFDRASELLQRISKPQIVQITHAPGGGGTTIARRVLWDLHKTHPCAIAKLDNAPEHFGPESEGEKYLSNLCKRIELLEEHCDRTPAILIDGNSKQVRRLSDCLVRMLEGRALILRCVNYEQQIDWDENDLQSNQGDKWVYKNKHYPGEDEHLSGGKSDFYFSAEDEFKVNHKLKDDDNDYSEFKNKYDRYCKIFPRSDDKGSVHSNRLERVFHFPMMAMLDEFEKLNSIVYDSLDKLKNVEYEMAIMTAFLQKYSGYPTPASLVKKFVKKNNQTYREITKHFSETLMNLMVPEKAPSKEKYIGYSLSDDEDDDDDCISHGSSSSIEGPILQSYSFQHPKIAQLVLDHSKRSLDQITQDLIQHNIIKDYWRDDENRPLIESLFLYNKESAGAHFSILIDKLAKGASRGRIFEEAAKQTQDVTFYSHVARFFAYEGDFERAKNLLTEGFKTDKNAKIDKKLGVFSTQGHISYMEMTHKDTKISDVDSLKQFSEKALRLFRKGRGNPPWTYPNPLLGEVKVWQFCLEWLIQSKEGDVEEALKYILRDSFFSGTISECIYLLDEVDRIVDTVPTLNNPEHTKSKSLEGRRLLVQTVGRERSNTRRRGFQDINVDRVCIEIISKYTKTASEKELIRLRVVWMLNGVQKQIHRLDIGQKSDLYSWLNRLVNDFKMFIHARELMESAAELRKPPFDIDEALKIVSHWQKYHPNDLISYLYQSMFSFLKVRKGFVGEYRQTFESAINACRLKIQGNQRRRQQHYFLGIHTAEEGVCNIFPRSKLESLYRNKYPPKSSNARSKEDKLDQTFWDKHCRAFLLECYGRIEYTEGSRGKNFPHIMMEPGSIKVHVPRNVVATAHYDYQPDSRVSFVVGFTLCGPVAKGIKSMPMGRKV